MVSSREVCSLHFTDNMCVINSGLVTVQQMTEYTQINPDDKQSTD